MKTKACIRCENCKYWAAKWDSDKWCFRSYCKKRKGVIPCHIIGCVKGKPNVWYREQQKEQFERNRYGV